VGFSEEGEYTDVLGQFRFPGEECEVLIRGGEGVGMVTKPGLEIPVGDWAINPGPRRMIARNITEVAQKMLSSGRKIWVEIFVPEGKRLARKTLNSRLGIIGGISILGTTGIVRPMSHEAYKMSIGLAINVAEAMKQDTLVLTTGRRSEKFAMSHWRDIREEAFVQIGDYFEFALDAASRKEIFDRVNMAVFFGKALKMACGTPHTHASQSDIDLNRLSLWASEITDDGELCDRIKNANTAREALKWIKKGDMRVIHIVGSNMIGSARRFSGNSVDVRGVIFDFDGKIIFDSEKELQR
jgi:cobalt-precorrin-5B (C1)-methyltransferase